MNASLSSSLILSIFFINSLSSNILYGSSSISINASYFFSFFFLDSMEWNATIRMNASRMVLFILISEYLIIESWGLFIGLIWINCLHYEEYHHSYHNVPELRMMIDIYIFLEECLLLPIFILFVTLTVWCYIISLYIVRLTEYQWIELHNLLLRMDESHIQLLLLSIPNVFIHSILNIHDFKVFIDVDFHIIIELFSLQIRVVNMIDPFLFSIAHSD